MKREPLLCDLLIADPKYAAAITNKREAEIAHHHLLQAKRFVLDEEATKMVAEMIVEMPRIIADAQDFAIPPFKTMWIEFPYDPFFYAINPNVIARPSDRDQRIGYLISGNTVRVGSIADAKGTGVTGAWVPIEYNLWNPLTLEQELALSQKLQVARSSIDLVFWGTSAMQFLNESDKEGMRALRANHSFRLIPSKALEGQEPFVFDTSIAKGAGDLRNIIAMLLFLNRTRDVQEHTQVPTKSALIRRKSSAMLSHSVIRLKANPLKRLGKSVASSEFLRRLHDVRGHFCHNKTARLSGCMHAEWEEYEPRHWKCLDCGGLRWWRNEHKRGNEEVGVATSEYRVTE